MTGERYKPPAIVAYAKRSQAWRHGEKTEDELLQRIWNLASDVDIMADALTAAEERYELMVGEARKVNRAWKEASDALTAAETERDKALRAEESFRKMLASAATERDDARAALAETTDVCNADLNCGVDCDCGDDAICLAHRILAAIPKASA